MTVIFCTGIDLVSLQTLFCCRVCHDYVLLCSLAVLDPRVGHTMDVLSPFVPVILIDSSSGSSIQVLMLSIQSMHGLPRLRAAGIVPCIISFSRQLLSDYTGRRPVPGHRPGRLRP